MNTRHWLSVSRIVYCWWCVGLMMVWQMSCQDMLETAAMKIDTNINKHHPGTELGQVNLVMTILATHNATRASCFITMLIENYNFDQTITGSQPSSFLLIPFDKKMLTVTRTMMKLSKRRMKQMDLQNNANIFFCFFSLILSWSLEYLWLEPGWCW